MAETGDVRAPKRPFRASLEAILVGFQGDVMRFPVVYRVLMRRWGGAKTSTCGATLWHWRP